MYMAAKLSHLIGIEAMEVMVNSDNNLLNHDSSAVTRLRLLYSASAEDGEIVACFLDFQEIKVSPKKMTKPLMDFLL